jgi:hypothetical protein
MDRERDWPRPVSRRAALLAALLGLGVATSGEPVGAQTARDESVQFRYRPDYLPLGLDLDLLLTAPLSAFDGTGRPVRTPTGGAAESAGVWTVYPRLELALLHDDNIFRAQSSTRADFAAIARQQVYAKADLPRHELAIYLGADQTRYRRETAQDTNQFRVNMDAKFDLADDWKATLFVEHAYLVEPRGTTADPRNAPNPTLYHLTTVATGFAYDAEPWISKGALEWRRYSYGDNGAVSQRDRDRDEYFAKLRAGYELYEGTIAYLEPVVNQRRYTQHVANDGFVRDSRGFEIQGGIHYDASGVSFVEVGLGYMRQTYDDSRFPTASGPSFSGKLIWNPTDVITIIGDAGRRVDETTLSGVANVINTFTNFTLDYEIVEELIASVRTGYNRGRYARDAVGFERDDKIMSYGAGVRYMIGPHAQVGIDWTRWDRSSNLASASYVANTILATIILQW